MPLSDLYDLADKIIAARSANVSPQRIAAAKRGKRTLVVEGGVLHIYPDVYDRRTKQRQREVSSKQ